MRARARQTGGVRRRKNKTPREDWWLVHNTGGSEGPPFFWLLIHLPPWGGACVQFISNSNHLGLGWYFIYTLEGRGGSKNPDNTLFREGFVFDFWSLWYQENPDSGKNRAARAAAVGSASEKSGGGRGEASDGSGSWVYWLGFSPGLWARALEIGAAFELVEQTCNRDHSG